MMSVVDKRRIRQVADRLLLALLQQTVGTLETTTGTATETSKSNRFNEQNNNSTSASRLFEHFFAVDAA